VFHVSIFISIVFCRTLHFGICRSNLTINNKTIVPRHVSDSRGADVSRVLLHPLYLLFHISLSLSLSPLLQCIPIAFLALSSPASQSVSQSLGFQSCGNQRQNPAR